MTTYKIIIVGNANVGKTSLLNRYIDDNFTTHVPSTIGIEFIHKEMGDETKLSIWDTAGQERFQSIGSALYRNADAIIFVYDVSDIDSYHSLEYWYRQYLTYGDRDSIKILVGNKSDLAVIVHPDKAMAWARERNMFYETACPKNGLGCVKVFATIVSQLNKLPKVKAEKLRIKRMPKSDRCCY